MFDELIKLILKAFLAAVITVAVLAFLIGKYS